MRIDEPTSPETHRLRLCPGIKRAGALFTLRIPRRSARLEAVMTCNRPGRGCGWKGAALAVTAFALAGCAGAPPVGTQDYAAWVKDKQEMSAAIEKAGCYCGADWFKDLPTR